jgi:ribonuclease BN (tRNA processing enzyme)
LRTSAISLTVGIAAAEVAMRVTCVGTGDAFGAGGRLQTCFHIARPGHAPVLLDCGATALVGLKRFGLPANDIESVFVTHLHGDHFGGLIWMLLDAQFGAIRTKPLTVYGPPTIEARLKAASDALYPGAFDRPVGYQRRFVEISPKTPITVDGLAITVIEVDHPSGAPSYGMRLATGLKSLAFTGDTAWTPSVLELGRGADVYIMDCWSPDGAPAVHMSFEQIAGHLDQMDAKRIVLTHMNDAMIAHVPKIKNARISAAFDGRIIDV